MLFRLIIEREESRTVVIGFNSVNSAEEKFMKMIDSWVMHEEEGASFVFTEEFEVEIRNHADEIVRSKEEIFRRYLN